MKFYVLGQPESRSDYADIWINGMGRTLCGFPGMECSVCGESAPLNERIWPHRLPERLENDPRMRSFWPIPEADHLALRAEVQDAMNAAYPGMAQLQGGERFPPIEWVVPSRPESDFFWGLLEGPIVSARVADAMPDAGVTGIAFSPVDDVRCGIGPASREPPIPESGEPEDLVEWANSKPEPGQQFFVMEVASEGNYTVNMREQTLCPACGRREVERSGDWHVWEDSIWNGQDVFHFPTTQWIIVTEKVANLLSVLNVDNVSLREIVPGERFIERFWWDEEEDPGAEIEQELPPLPRGPAVAGELSQESDRRLIARFLEEQNLAPAAVERRAPDNRDGPDFEISVEGKHYYILIISLLPPSDGRRLSAWRKLLLRMCGYFSRQAIARRNFARLAPLVQEAVWRFHGVNPEHDADNILIFVDHDREARVDHSLWDVVTADDSDYRSGRGGYLNPEYKGDRRWIDLYVWLNPLSPGTMSMGTMPIWMIDLSFREFGDMAAELGDEHT